MRSVEILALRGEVKMQCFRGMNTAELLETHLAVKRVRFNRDDPSGAGKALIAFTVDTWALVHGILSAGGIVASILWPNPPSEGPVKSHSAKVRRDRAVRAIARAEEIWRSWPMPPAAVLEPLKDRRTRNAMEHVEHGAPEWITSFDGGDVNAFGVGVSSSPEDVKDSRRYFRYFFVDTWDLRVGNFPANLKKIVTALSVLQESLPFEVNLTTGGLELVPTDPSEMIPGIRAESKNLSSTR